MEGDKALKQVGECLKKCITRETDMIARYGGEEFVAVIPYLDQDGVYEIISNIQKSIEMLKIHHPHKENGYLTVSIGAAVVSLNFDVTPSIKVVLLENADKALYEAKNTGRNKVVLYCLDKNHI